MNQKTYTWPTFVPEEDLKKVSKKTEKAKDQFLSARKSYYALDLDLRNAKAFAAHRRSLEILRDAEKAKFAKINLEYRGWSHCLWDGKLDLTDLKKDVDIDGQKNPFAGLRLKVERRSWRASESYRVYLQLVSPYLGVVRESVRKLPDDFESLSKEDQLDGIKKVYPGMLKRLANGYRAEHKAHFARFMRNQ